MNLPRILAAFSEILKYNDVGSKLKRSTSLRQVISVAIFVREAISRTSFDLNPL